MATIKDRLKEEAQRQGLSLRSFEARAGLLRGNISNMGANSSIGSDKLAKIIAAFPSIDLHWLITGEALGLQEQPQLTTSMDDSNIRQRITLFFDYKGISDYKSEKELNLSKGYWNKSKNPTGDILARLCGIYPDLSPEWLLTGRGEMLVHAQPQPAPSPPDPSLVNDLLSRLTAQAEEIGRLRARIEELEKEMAASARGAHGETLAHVG